MYRRMQQSASDAPALLSRQNICSLRHDERKDCTPQPARRRGQRRRKATEEAEEDDTATFQTSTPVKDTNCWHVFPVIANSAIQLDRWGFKSDPARPRWKAWKHCCEELISVVYIATKPDAQHSAKNQIRPLCTWETCLSLFCLPFTKAFYGLFTTWTHEINPIYLGSAQSVVPGCHFLCALKKMTKISQTTAYMAVFPTSTPVEDIHFCPVTVDFAMQLDHWGFKSELAHPP